ncbi:MAG: endolytic transglycosylase MltG [Clostridiales bacterium]|nr:endolytic transglycosylase MltG [Clostridiales bacterium]
MHRVCYKSLALGLGIGIIITASANLIFHNASEIEKDKEIKNNVINFERSSDRINNDASEKIVTDEKINIEVNTENNKEESAPSIAGDKEEDEIESVEKDYVLVEIIAGMASMEIAQLLYDKGLIEDVEIFLEIATSMDAIKILRRGMKRIPRDSSIEEIVEILIKVN